MMYGSSCHMVPLCLILVLSKALIPTVFPAKYRVSAGMGWGDYGLGHKEMVIICASLFLDVHILVCFSVLANLTLTFLL